MRFTGIVLGAWVVLTIAGCDWLIPPSAAPSGNLAGSEPAIGVPYPVSVYTHCGLRHVEFDGSNWEISGVLSDGSFNPPPGFGNPFDNGTVTLITYDRARYRSEFGMERMLTRGGGLPWVEGCY
jgi:hypothetical protein